MMNDEACRKIGWIIKTMHAEASIRKAPVFLAEERTAGDPFRILVFTMLSARTRDETTMRAVERLFSIADTPGKIRSLGRKKLENLLYGVGFYRVKAGNLLEICRMVEEKGHVPDTLEELLGLPGIGRKTANIVLARAFSADTLGVDVHVHRISNRLGLVKTRKPEETERALVKAIPTEHLSSLNRSFVAFGQTVCRPLRPMCGSCPLKAVCWRVGVREPCRVCRYGIH